MCFLNYFKIVSLLIVITSCCGETTDERFNSLEKCLTVNGVPAGSVYHRDDGDKYTELNWQWNTLNGYIKPRAYLQPTKVSDIQKAVHCCQKYKIRIVPRGGGHSYAKNGFGDVNSLIVDMSRINEISLDSKAMTCDIGAGVRNGEIQYWLSKYNFLLPVGICPTVGVAGLALGGGWGYFARMYGLASDSIIGLEMVDAKGRLLVINKDQHSDLFFIRGAGGGSYGIVTKFKFRMYPLPASIIHGVLEYPLSDFPKFYESWQYLIQETENSMFNFGTLVVISKKTIIFEIFHVNTDKQKMQTWQMIQFISSFNFPNSKKRSVEDLTYAKFLFRVSQYYSKEPLTDMSQMNMTRHIEFGWKKVKSFYVNKILDKDEIKKLTLLLQSYVEFGKLALLQNGGEMNKFSPTENAFVHRNNMYDVQLWSYSPEGDSLKVRQAMDKAMTTFYEDTKSPFVLNHKESYQNYLDVDIHDFLDRYYKDNLKKLIEIKMLYDPHNVFHHRHSIPNKFQFNFIDKPILVIDEENSDVINY